MPQTKKQEIGAWGEQVALDFLVQHGYVILERNYYSKVGEIDIIATVHERRFGKTLVFIEVKTRSARRQSGMAERSVGVEKKMHMQRAAQWYCQERHININTTPIQFEQVSVYREKGGKTVCRQYVLPA